MYYYNNELYHHGILGQKWGVRRFQNEDGSYKPGAEGRYDGDSISYPKSRKKHLVSGNVSTISKKDKVGDKKPSYNNFIKENNNKNDYGYTSTYSKNDRDFDDSNYKESNRYKDTDFFVFTKDDGSTVVLEEDMKWVLPPGANIDDEIEKIEKKFEDKRNKDIDRLADEVISGKYGNGQERVKKLGPMYDQVQKRVNEKMRMKHSYNSSSELYHHGILGMKWGVRRYQNKDGSYTSEGKRRRREDLGSIRIGKREIPKSTIKKAAIAAATIGTVAAAAYYVKKHPETIAKVISKAKNIPVRDITLKTINKGKDYVKKTIKNAAQETLRGIKDGIKEAPYKVGKVAAGGAAILIANKLVEEAIGKNQSDKYKQAYNAYNKKNKIGSLPKD